MRAHRRFARTVVSLLLLVPLFIPGRVFSLEFEAVELGFSQAWTGNAWVGNPNDAFDGPITGSETVPVDGFLAVGARLRLIEGMMTPADALVVAPALEFGLRYYVLFASGRVAPTQIETAAGGEGNTPGRGSARVLTIRFPVPVAYTLRLAEQHELALGFSPTLVFRVPAGHREALDEDDNLSDLYGWFYRDLRFVMPELSLTYRFLASSRLDVGIRLEYGASILDMLDPQLPVWDGNRAAVGVRVGVRPPFAGLLRQEAIR